MVGRERRLAIALEYARAVLGVQLLAASSARMAADNLVRIDELPPQKAGNDGLSHHAAADECETSVVERSPLSTVGFNIRTIHCHSTCTEESLPTADQNGVGRG
jgi:hypothetical protein